MQTRSNFKDRLVLEDVRILFRNFAGHEDKFNKAGDRNFGILLDPDIARDLEKDGWNVKWLQPRDEGEEPAAYMRVTVKYGRKPPRVIMITSRGRTTLKEDTVDILDDVDIFACDLIIRPYNWNVRGETGVAAYLQSLFVTIEESPLDRKYLDIPDDEPPWEENS